MERHHLDLIKENQSTGSRINDIFIILDSILIYTYQSQKFFYVVHR